MDPISGADRLAMLLRQRLIERSKAEGGRQPSRAGGASPGTRAVETLAAAGEASERQLRRALIEALLAEQLGETLRNEPRFQQVVEQVAEAIEEDAQAAALVGEVLARMQAQRR